MYQSIGINLSKSLDAATKRIKIPAITQRNYYKSNNNYEEEFINFYKSDSTNNDIDYDENLNYLDDEEINDEDNELNKDEKWILKTLKSKNIKKVKDVLIFMIDENDDIFIQRKKE